MGTNSSKPIVQETTAVQDNKELLVIRYSI